MYTPPLPAPAETSSPGAKGAPSSAPTAATSSSTSSATNSPGGTLPKTGPADYSGFLLVGLVLAAVGAVLLAFARTRRGARR